MRGERQGGRERIRTEKIQRKRKTQRKREKREVGIESSEKGRVRKERKDN